MLGGVFRSRDDFPLYGRRFLLRDLQIVRCIRFHPHLRGSPEIDRRREEPRRGTHESVRHERLYLTDSMIWISCFKSVFTISLSGMPFCAARSAR